jgi:hypothetical protein
MNKKRIAGALVFALAFLAAGAAGAQTLAAPDTAAPAGLPGFDTALAVPLSGGYFALDGGFAPDALANGTAAASPGWMTGSPFMAGLLNIPIGLWSWMNRDWKGAIITTGLYAGGAGLLIYGFSNSDRIMGFGGVVILVAAPVYGFFRGMGQCRERQAAGLAEALNDNPLKHISLAALPDGRGGAAGVLTYTLRW